MGGVSLSIFHPSLSNTLTLSLRMLWGYYRTHSWGDSPCMRTPEQGLRTQLNRLRMRLVSHTHKNATRTRSKKQGYMAPQSNDLLEENVMVDGGQQNTFKIDR